MTLPAPFVSTVMEVDKAWIDYNGHMNMAYYNVLCDRGAEQALDLMGIRATYPSERRLTTYTAEVHVCYVRELHLGDRVKVTFQVIDHDEKRLHFYQEVQHVDGWLAATSETLLLHIDMSGPKVSPFPADIMARIDAFAAPHAGLGMPERAGRAIGIKRKPQPA